MSSALKIEPQYQRLSLSIIIPTYNEEKTILQILEKISQQSLNRAYEIIIVDDGSSDETANLCKSYITKNPQLSLQYHYQKNQGKGGAVKTGLANASHEIILIQDADLEYNPKEYPLLLAPIDNGAKVVYGSRNLVEGKRPHSSWMFYLGGLVVTMFTNILFGSKLSDEATCYKVFRKNVIDDLNFKRKDFSWEPEVTARILKRKINIAEVPISYTPRSKSEGKKISWRDGVKALWVLIYERFTNH